MPKAKGTAKTSLTPKKASKRKMVIKRPSKVTKSKPTKKTTPKKTRKKPSKAQVFEFTDLEGKKHTLTELQYRFADLCVGLDKSPFECVIEAGFDVYDDKGKLNKNLTWVIATEYLNMPKIRAYINKQLASVKLTKEVVMLELAQMVVQKVDYKTKTKAMDMYFKIIGEYAPEKHKHEFDEDLKKSIDKIAAVLP